MNYSKLLLYTYTFEIKALFSDDSEVINISPYFNKFKISSNFVEDIFPLLICQFKLLPEIILKIQNDPDVKFSLEIFAIEDTDDELESIYLSKQILKPIRMTRTPLDISDELEVVDEEDSTQNELTYTTETFEMILLPKDSLILNKQLISGVYHNATVLDALVNLTNKLDTKVNIIQPDNKVSYSQIILKPGNILSNIRFIDQVYGFYNTGLSMFYTFDELVIGPQDNRRFSSSNDTIDIYIKFPSKNNTEEDITYGYYMDTNGKKIINANISDILSNDYKTSLKEIMGNNLKNFYENNIEREGLREDDFSDENKIGKTRVYKNLFNNIQKEEEFKEKIKNSKLLFFNFTGMNIGIEDINRKFLLHFDNDLYSEEYDGTYNLMKMILSFDKGTTSGIVGLTGTCFLRKIE